MQKKKMNFLRLYNTEQNENNWAMEISIKQKKTKERHYNNNNKNKQTITRSRGNNFVEKKK